MKPRALVATTYKWYPTARLAVALAKAGFQVEAVCPSGHPMFKTSAVRERHSYSVFSPVRSFASCAPALLMPGISDLRAAIARVSPTNGGQTSARRAIVFRDHRRQANDGGNTARPSDGCAVVWLRNGALIRSSIYGRLRRARARTWASTAARSFGRVT